MFFICRRSAGDGCSPLATAASNFSQDNHRTCYSSDRGHQSPPSQPSPDLVRLQQTQQPYCCNDPDHCDQQIVMEMQQILADRDAELQRLTEEKRFYQLELIHWERNLSHPRSGLPLSLIPYNDNLHHWRGFSAPPVTKPRLMESSLHMMFSSANSYESQEMYSPSIRGSPERQMVDQYSAAPTKGYQPTVQGCWLPTFGSARLANENEYDYDDDRNEGFTTPQTEHHLPFFL